MHNGDEPIARLRAWVDRRAEERAGAGLKSFRGSDWYQISRQEEWVFGLSLSQMPRLIAVLEAYDAIAGIGDDDLLGEEVCEEARQVLHWLRRESIWYDDFKRFAGMFGVSNRTAHAFFYKHQFYNLRVDRTRFASAERTFDELDHEIPF